MKIKGSVAVVTGGASGLGEATARRLAEGGGRVTILDRPQSEGERVAKEIGGLFCAADVTSGEQVAAGRRQNGRYVRRPAHRRQLRGRRHRRADDHQAGADAARDLQEDGRDQPRSAASTSFASPPPACPRGTPNDDGERGVIINTASAAAFDGQIGQVAYSASKGGVVGMTLPIARDLASLGIRCMTIAPGTFDTPMLALLPEEARQALRQGRAVSQASRQARRVRGTRLPHRRERDAERRDDPPRRGDTDAAEMRAKGYRLPAKDSAEPLAVAGSP